MEDRSPQIASLNNSAMIKRGMTLNAPDNSDSEDDVPDIDNNLRLPKIVLKNLHMTKANDEFSNIPGLKSTKVKPHTKRAATEKKQVKREHSVDLSGK